MPKKRGRVKLAIRAMLLALVFMPVVALAAVDTDGDELSDTDEQRLGTNSALADTDGDAYPDGVEIRNGYDPNSPAPTKLPKRIVVDRTKQELQYLVGPYVIGTHRVSTGKRSTPTPAGIFRIASKQERAWSRRAGLWMPKWMNFTGPGAPTGLFGIHELPEWRSGKKEGANHLGVPVSGGCVRLGVGAAAEVFAWADVGTTVVVR